MRAAWILIVVAAGCGYAKPALTGGDDTTGSDAGPVSCTPGTGTCNGETAHTCNAAGDGYEDFDCDPTQGLVCDPSVGACKGSCASTLLAKSNLGCEFYPTVTGAEASSVFAFAVLLTNPGVTVANVTIDGAGLVPAIDLAVPPVSSIVQNLPWQYDLKLCGPGDPTANGCVQRTGVLAIGGAYHLRSDAPLSVSQFAPVDTEINGGINNGGTSAFTNEAALLFPATAWGADYRVASYAPISGQFSFPSELIVTAQRANTHVTITTTASTAADVGSNGLPAFSAGQAQMVLLGSGDALELATINGDLTGTHITADQPIQVIGSHMCGDVPALKDACDHFEESMIPRSALGTDYVVVPPQTMLAPTGTEEVVRILATEADTHLTYDPMPPGAKTSIASAGGMIEIASATPFEIKADKKISVVQYMEGGGDGIPADGDPAMTVAVPVAQWRGSYSFGMPPQFAEHYADIIAPVGTHLLVDTVAATVNPLNAAFGFARVKLQAGAGFHTVTGDKPLSVQTYGVENYTAFWYPAGLDLKLLP